MYLLLPLCMPSQCGLFKLKAVEVLKTDSFGDPRLRTWVTFLILAQGTLTLCSIYTLISFNEIKQKKPLGLCLWMSLMLAHFPEVWIAPHRSPWKIGATATQVQQNLKFSTLRSLGSGLDMNKYMFSVLWAYLLGEAKLAGNTVATVNCP